MLNEIIKTSVATTLKSNGFTKKKYTWTRTAEDFVQVINFQLSDYSESNSETFTINYGVFSERVWNICWGKSVPSSVKEVDCFPRLRVGDSLSDYKADEAGEIWWTLRNGDNCDHLCEKIKSILEQDIVPQLDKLSDYEGILDILASRKGIQLMPIDRIYMGIVSYFVGDVSFAFESIHSVSKISGAWDRRAKFVIANLTSN